MSTVPTAESGRGFAGTGIYTEAASPARQAYRILHLGFTVLPIVAGLDKFFNLLVDWNQYLSPLMNNLLG